MDYIMNLAFNAGMWTLELVRLCPCGAAAAFLAFWVASAYIFVSWEDTRT